MAWMKLNDMMHTRILELSAIKTEAQCLQIFLDFWKNVSPNFLPNIYLIPLPVDFEGCQFQVASRTEGSTSGVGCGTNSSATWVI